MHGIFLTSIISQEPRQYYVIRGLGPYRVASHLRNNGYEIQVIDFINFMTDDQLERLLYKFIDNDTKFIGLSMMIFYNHGKIIQYMNRFSQLLKKIKTEFPQLKIIIGGSTVSTWSRRYQNKEVFDYTVKGYGEDQTLALFDHYYKNGPHPAFELVDGNKQLSENLVIENKFKFTKDTHRWHRRDCIQPNEALPIEFARGCIFKCSFCGYPHIGKHKNDYTKHLECVKEELLHNYNAFGTTSYYVTDDTFNADTEFVKGFTELSKSLPFKLRYAAYIRPDLLHGNPETEDMFLENGLHACFFGIESFNEVNAKMVGKPWSAKHAKKYLPYIFHDKWKESINITSSFIAGLPNDTLEDLKDVNRWFVDNDMSAWVWHPLHVQRTSEYYKSEFDVNAEKYGINFNLVEGKSRWYHSTCDELTALDWAVELTNDIKMKRDLLSWLHIELLTYQYDTICKTNLIRVKPADMKWNYIVERAYNIIVQYYKDLLAL